MDNDNSYEKTQNDIQQESAVEEIPEISPSLKENPSFFQKLLTTVSEGQVFGGLVMYSLFIINLIGVTIFARKSGIGITQSILYMFHIDTLSLDSFSFLEVNILISYIFSFIFGGLLIFALLRIGYLICKLCGFIYSNKITRIVLLSFMGIYFIIALILFIAGNNILSVSIYNWAMPLLAFLGGFFMYCISLRDVNVY